MLKLGSPEIIIIAIIALWFFGDKKLKDFAKRVGESTKEIKKIKDEIEGKGNKDEQTEA